jgi:hypothetical protein
MMIHADPWNEIERLEELLEGDLLAEIERAAFRAVAESFCVDKCRVDGRCPIAHAIQSKAHCPLWMYVRVMNSAVVSESLC